MQEAMEKWDLQLINSSGLSLDGKWQGSFLLYSEKPDFPLMKGFFRPSVFCCLGRRGEDQKVLILFLALLQSSKY
jgi:hypothetical protein